MKLKYWAFLLLWNVVPVILVHLGARAFWTNQGDNTSVAIFETSFSMFILPSCLLFNYSVERVRAMNRFGVWLTMFVTLCLSIFLGFMNWADTVGSWRHPDSETIAVVELKFFVGFAIIGLFTLITLIKNRKRLVEQ